jgi:hypothetical protein
MATMCATEDSTSPAATFGQPLVSVIIPTYNVSPFIDDALASLQRQTFTHWECICVDDGSTDATPAKLAKWVDTDPRIRAFQQQNAGPGAARNRGLRESASRYFCFLDADDAMHPRALERLIDITRAHHADIGVVSYESFSGDTLPDHYDPASTAEASVFEAPILPRLVNPSRYRFHVWGKLYDKTRMADVFFPEAYAGAEDTFFTVSVYARAQRVAIADEPLYLYRLRPESLSRKANKSLDYIAGSQDVAILCDTLCRQQNVSHSLSCKLIRTWGTNRIFTELLEAAASPDVDNRAFARIVQAARKALAHLRKHTGSMRKLLAPQHVATFAAGVLAKSRLTLQALALLREFRQRQRRLDLSD